MSTHQVHETTTHYGSTHYVVSTKETPRDIDPSYSRRSHAEFHAEIMSRLPESYSVKRRFPRKGSIDKHPYWSVHDEDDKKVATWVEGCDLPSGESPQDMLVALANLHASKAP